MRHRTDPATLIAGLLFCLFGALYLIGDTEDWRLPWVWLLPGLLVGLGIAGLAGIIARNNRR